MSHRPVILTPLDYTLGHKSSMEWEGLFHMRNLDLWEMEKSEDMNLPKAQNSKAAWVSPTPSSAYIGMVPISATMEQDCWGHSFADRLKASVQFSRSVLSDSFRPHGLQHARPPCPSPTPGVYSSSCPLSQWCHPTISSSVIPFSCSQSFPAQESFQMSQFFPSDGQST